MPQDTVITHELAKQISLLSREVGRQIGLLLDRKGNVKFVILGDPRGLLLPDLSEFRAGVGRLKGLRLIHTHLDKEGLTKDDLNDLALLRLDMIGAVEVDERGLPCRIHLAHLLPTKNEGRVWNILEPTQVSRLDIDFRSFIRDLEDEISRSQGLHAIDQEGDRAILVSVTTGPKSESMENIQELEELARSSEVKVLESAIFHRQSLDPKTLIGRGQLNDLVIRALYLGANLLIFNEELTPSQVRNITDFTDLRVIDRNQLILDIFARRARSREGMLQVELAQLKYLLPRLGERDTALSRLTGGIGGRGPGETKLEIDRRRIRVRIHKLEEELKKLSRQREQLKALRNKRSVPIVSIIGYTNAGKSTLLNTLTHSSVAAEDRMFATLDPTNRRIKLPKDREVIITDTVGFIKNLPKALLSAFKATLDELADADLLIHVIDASSASIDKQVSSVEKILEELHLNRIPTVRVLNKEDLVDPLRMGMLRKKFSALSICALKESTLSPLVREIDRQLTLTDKWRIRQRISGNA